LKKPGHYVNLIHEKTIAMKGDTDATAYTVDSKKIQPAEKNTEKHPQKWFLLSDRAYLSICRAGGDQYAGAGTA
jgi:hypothetical protein